jgi:hypothetical protein
VFLIGDYRPQSDIPGVSVKVGNAAFVAVHVQ